MIDEKKLIEEIDYYIKEAGWGEETNKILSWCKEIINNQTKISEWILCSEKLPPKHADVLVSFNDIQGPMIAWYSKLSNQWVNSSTGKIIKATVVAWQQLPEPYQKK